MMRSQAILIAALFAATGLSAQDAPKPESLPNPKTDQHKALKRWVGSWKVTGRMDAVPGVPGMEKPVTSEGSESGSLTCDGLWLKWESQMTCDGKQSTGIWLVGYDPFEKHYISYVASSDEHCEGLTRLTGKFDERSDTWTWIGDTPQGKMKSVCKFSGLDKLTETLYMIGADGKEKQFMVMDRVRTKSARSLPVLNASVKVKSKTPASKHLATLLKDIGTWDVVVESSSSGETTKDEGRERVQAICDGRWTWSEFHCKFQGKPFVGHALVGWDGTQQKYASLWIDSMSATPCVTTGSYDEKTKTYTLDGVSTGPDGKRMKVDQTIVCKDEDSRVMNIKFDGPEMKSTMQITYARRAKND